VPPDPRHYWHMTALRSRRLEALLGAGLDAARYEHFHSLVQSQVSESFDLDFKREHYGNAARDKLALAGDAAALANSAGALERTAELPPLPADTRQEPDIAKYDQLLTSAQEAETRKPRP
jgi:hypothetical protein